MDNAERLAHYFGDRLHYCYERKSWLIWDDNVWRWDTGEKAATFARKTVRNIYLEAANEPDDKARRELAAHAIRSEAHFRISAMIHQAQSESGIPIQLSALDRNQWLFNCLNGTIDLRTSQLQPHRKEDLLTILVPIKYDPAAQCPLWLKFLNDVTGGNIDLQAYLQRAIGYSLTGDTREQVIFFLYGLGNNGKSTFTMTIRTLLGGYAGRLNAEDLMLKDKSFGGNAKEGIANLLNKRYVVGSEVQDGRRLDIGLLKDLIGSETIKARRLYEREFEFRPTWKLWLYGNHKPVIADSALAIWRRVKLIPFEVTIPPDKIDKQLQTKLSAELPGILAWAVQGCLNWQQHGLGEPAADGQKTK